MYVDFDPLVIHITIILQSIFVILFSNYNSLNVSLGNLHCASTVRHTEQLQS